MEARRTIAMIAVGALIFFAGFLASQPENATTYENCIVTKKFAELLRPSGTNQAEQNATDHANSPDCRPPKWYAVFQRIEGWQFIIAAIGIGIIARQSVATARSAKAAEDGIKLMMAKDRARLEIIANDVPLGVGKTVFITYHLKNIGYTTGFLGEGGMNLIKGGEQITVDYSKCASMPFTGSIPANGQTPNEGFVMIALPAPLTETEVNEYLGGKAFVHCYGYIRYRDVFEAIHEAKLHLRWSPYRPPTNPTQIVGDWLIAGPSKENCDK